MNTPLGLRKGSFKDHIFDEYLCFIFECASHSDIKPLSYANSFAFMMTCKDMRGMLFIYTIKTNGLNPILPADHAIIDFLVTRQSCKNH